jgi:hypothetical protein
MARVFIRPFFDTPFFSILTNCRALFKKKKLQILASLTSIHYIIS